MSATSAVLTVRVPIDVKVQLEQLAKATKRSKSFLAQEAIRHYVELEAWQIAETLKAIDEAEAGDFSTDDEVTAVMNKWSVHAG
jgi:RHH-type rel operon transcriptional repressor/antitoxin RelB